MLCCMAFLRARFEWQSDNYGTPMNLQARLDNLQDHIAAVLQYLPGATALYLFDSRGTAQADKFADIDVQVYTATFPAAQALWPYFLAVGSVEVAWPLDTALDTTTYSVLFLEESYYHKVDISLCAGEPPLNNSPVVNFGFHCGRARVSLCSSCAGSPVLRPYICVPASGLLLCLLSFAFYLLAYLRYHHPPEGFAMNHLAVGCLCVAVAP